MEHVLELIEKGQAGYVTAMGMGGVFVALLALYLFIAGIGKTYRFGKLRGREKTAPPPGSGSTAGEPEYPGAQIAAAVAAAIALADAGRSRGASISPDPATADRSAWRSAGRLALMRPFVRPKKD